MRKLKVTEMNRLSVNEYKRANKIPLIVVLDNVRSLHNVGAVFRTADAFRITEIYLCGITATPPQNEIHKTALGAEECVDWKYFNNTTEAVKQLISKGVKTFSVEQAEGSTTLQNIKINKQQTYAIILGNEVKGVQQEVVNLCEACIEIPQYGTKHSINVSVAAGIVMWEIAKQMWNK